jgi:hypothetical protein
MTPELRAQLVALWAEILVRNYLARYAAPTLNQEPEDDRRHLRQEVH